MPLTDKAVINAKPKAKPYKLADERGLYLLVNPTGSKLWRFKYRINGKERLLAFGCYPDVALKMARAYRDSAREHVAQGTDPSELRKADNAARKVQAANTFESLAREWHERGVKHGFKGTAWTTEYANRILSRLERDVFPRIGARPIADIKAPELRVMATTIAKRTIETAHRALRDCSSVFRYAIAHGKAEHDPTMALRSKEGHGVLPPVPIKHFPTITDPKAVGALLRAIDGYTGTPIVCAALKLSPLLFVRPGELRAAEWEEFDLAAKEWRIPAERMKMREAHIVPLCSQAVVILRELHTITGRSCHVFPGFRTNGRPMSENAVNGALRALGYAREQFTAHGFRSMASTLLNELGFNRDAIERQLAHAERDGVRAAYNRAEYLKERRQMMQQWANYLDKLKVGAEIVALRRGQQRK